MKTDIETELIDPEHWFHIGQSMYPTLRAGERILIDTYAGKEFRRGDVIVFSLPQKRKHVVHRVVSVINTAIRTKGDNNDDNDQWIITPEAVVGKVTHTLRNGRKRTILGGPAGHSYALALMSAQKCIRLFKKLFRPAYNRLSEQGLVRQIFSIDNSVQVITLKREGEPAYKLLWRDHVIGMRTQSAESWQILPPFRLFINEKRLPGQALDDLS